MKLYYSAASPFVRKVMTVARECGLDAKIEQEPVSVLPTQPNTALAKVNPLMKLPALIADDGTTLFESSLICQYLDSQHAGRKLVPDSGPARWRTLKLEALADGVCDAGILMRYEMVVRTEQQRSTPWIDGQRTKIVNGLDAIERDPAPLAGELDLGQIALACAIGWMEFRNVAGDLRSGRPKLFQWYDAIVKRPSLAATAPKG